MNAERISTDAEQYLSTVERAILDIMKRIEILGKKGSKVPILLRKVHVKSINLLIHSRDEAGVHQNNPYVFTRTNYGSLYPLNACDELRNYV